jgi:hypothetical protein
MKTDDLKNPKLFSNTFNPYDASAKHKPVLDTNRLNEPWVQQRARPRRNRKSEVMRGLSRENIVTPK